MKRRLGQYFTKKDYWKKSQIENFIQKYNFKNVLDPFAGNGDLLKHFKKTHKIFGYDFDKKLKWKYNDSLASIPYINKTFIITNPPYLSRVSSKRKNINHNVFKENHKWSDLYQVAMEKILKIQLPGIAILPETFINSKFPKKNIYSITILIPNPFEDTETPVCIVCFDGKKNFEKTIIFKNSKKIGYLKDIKESASKLLKNSNKISVKFNIEKGQLGLIAYDSSSKNKKIQFIKADKLNYNKPQKISSRVVSKIEINQKVNHNLISLLNKKLKNYREETNDVLLSPFKGNTKKNERRRRLDYRTARKIINSINL